MSAVAPTLQKFFTDRLATQRYASPATIAAYRDAFRLLLVFVADRKKITRPASTSPISTPRPSRRSSPIWKSSGTTAFAAEMPAWPRFTRCSGSPRLNIPNTPR